MELNGKWAATGEGMRIVLRDGIVTETAVSRIRPDSP